MGFVSCPNCSKRVSELAEVSACPECFHPMDPLELRLQQLQLDQIGAEERQRILERSAEEIQIFSEKIRRFHKYLRKEIREMEKM